MNDDVTTYIEQIKLDWQREIAQRLRQAIHDAVPDVTERIQYGKPHFLKNGKYAAVLGTAKGWVSFTIFNAGGLTAPDDVFEAGDPDRKTVKIKAGQEVDYDLLTELLRQAADSL